MNFKKSDILIGVLFICIIIGTAIMQTGLKEKPQWGMLLFALITLVFFFAKQNSIATILFYILFGTMLFINYFMLTNWSIGIINPDRGYVIVDGIKRRVMDMTWIWAVLVGFFLAPLSLFFYHKIKKRNRQLEISMTVLFLLVTAFIYIKYELLVG
jgi:hypothetical protein